MSVNHIVTPLDSATLDTKEQYTFYHKMVDFVLKELIVSIQHKHICTYKEVTFFKQYCDVLLYSIDLRQSSFLWINDLAEPEHLFNIPIFGEYELPFRILPLLMGVSWFISQKMTPQTAPGSESMELQMKMMQFMPIIFTVMFWSLPSGLILYWTVSNILSIFQQIYINRTVHIPQGG